MNNSKLTQNYVNTLYMNSTKIFYNEIDEVRFYCEQFHNVLVYFNDIAISVPLYVLSSYLHDVLDGINFKILNMETFRRFSTIRSEENPMQDLDDICTTIIDDSFNISFTECDPDKIIAEIRIKY